MAIRNAPVGRLIPSGKRAGRPVERAMDMNSLREKGLPMPGRAAGFIALGEPSRPPPAHLRDRPQPQISLSIHF